MKLRVLILCALIVCGRMQGQTDAKLASLAGRVMKEPGGEPIKKAVIELIAGQGDEAASYTAVSGADGEFQVDGIQPGRYHILIERTGFVFVDAKHHHSDATIVCLEDGQALTGQVFRMLPTAVLTGRVLDEDGDPMNGADVTIFQRLPGSEGRWKQVTGERTNDLGQYRISGIMPGRYLVAITPPPDLATLLSSKKTDPKSSDLAYVPTYYPGTIDRSQAGLLELRPGEEVPADFSMLRAPCVHIRGTVTNRTPGGHAVVGLIVRNGAETFNQAEVDNEGKFDLPNVAPGSYDLTAVEWNDEHPRAAHIVEEVRGSTPDALRLPLVSGATIHGRVRVVGDRRIDLSQVVLDLRGIDEGWESHLFGVRSGDAVLVKADGSFEFKDVPAGPYFLGSSTYASQNAEWYLSAVNMGGRDVRDTGFSASGNTLDLDVVLDSKGTRLDGTVTDEKGHAVANAVVVAVPDEKLQARKERYGKATTDQHGHFSLPGLIPGKYSLFAWESVEGDAYVDADFRKPYEDKALALRVDSTAAHISLKVIPDVDDSAQQAALP